MRRLSVPSTIRPTQLAVESVVNTDTIPNLMASSFAGFSGDRAKQPGDLVYVESMGQYFKMNSGATDPTVPNSWSPLLAEYVFVSNLELLASNGGSIGTPGMPTNAEIEAWCLDHQRTGVFARYNGTDIDRRDYTHLFYIDGTPQAQLLESQQSANQIVQATLEGGISTDYIITPSAQTIIYADNTNGATSATLPLNPSTNQLVQILDRAYQWGNNAFRLNMNGHRRNGRAIADGFIRFTQPGSMVVATYLDTATGWNFFTSFVGTTGAPSSGTAGTFAIEQFTVNATNRAGGFQLVGSPANGASIWVVNESMGTTLTVDQGFTYDATTQTVTLTAALQAVAQIGDIVEIKYFS